MSLNYAPQTVPAADYVRIFETEQQQSYPEVDALEQRLGFAVERDRLEDAARVLSCPMKAVAPNWQHGRVIYAVASDYLAGKKTEVINILDIGTAKGFSALCLQWALNDSDAIGCVTSIDVMHPMDRVRRNTIAEVDGLKTLSEILAPWAEANQIRFEKIGDVAATAYPGATGWLRTNPVRHHLVYVDGKHTYEAVRAEAAQIAKHQQAGDVIIFDDIQVPGVNKAVRELQGYDVDTLQALPTRRYAIARKR